MTKHLRIPLLLLLSAVCLLPSVLGQGGVKGKVRGPNGNGVPNAEISVRQDGKDIRSAKADAKGEFQISGLSPGKYNISFDADGYALGVLYNIQVESKIKDLGDKLILSRDRGSMVLVQGSVFFKEGTSVTGAQIKLEQVNSDGSTKSLGTSFSNSSGEFSFRRPSGAAKLRVTAKLKNATMSKDVEVDDPAIYRVALTLPMSAVDR
jgi:hypothetical protein